MNRNLQQLTESWAFLSKMINEYNLNEKNDLAIPVLPSLFIQDSLHLLQKFGTQEYYTIFSTVQHKMLNLSYKSTV